MVNFVDSDSALIIIRTLKLRKLRWVGHVQRMRDSRRADELLLGKAERKRLCCRPKIRLEDNTIWDLEEIDYEGDWRTLAQDRVTWHAYVLAAMNLRDP